VPEGSSAKEWSRACPKNEPQIHAHFRMHPTL
jgi:hypothetical protein